MSKSVAVVIIGAGPVGLALANLLGRAGVDTLVVERAEIINTAPRAIALDNEALRILQACGVGLDRLPHVRVPEVRYRSSIFGQFARVNFEASRDCLPQFVTFYQPDLESLLESNLARHPSVTLHRNTEALLLENTAGGARVRLIDHSGEGDGGIQTVRARFAVACDGASSPVRQLLGIGFTGNSYPEDWLIVDALGLSRAIEGIDFYCDPARPTPHMPAPGGRQRWEFMLHPGEDHIAMLSDDSIRQLLAPWAKADAITIERKAVYRFHARTASTFYRESVFLAGDAAHITPPFAGQGLVSGLRDALNLAWKLEFALLGRLPDRALTSYDTERRPHAIRMIRLAQIMGRVIAPKNPVQSFVVQGLARIVTLIPGVRRLVTELKIKPQNRFDRGLFLPDFRWRGLIPGTHFPQIRLGDSEGGEALSDRVFSGRLLLVGLGCRPEDVLSPPDIALWQKLGGATLSIRSAGGHAGSGPEGGSGMWVDTTGALGSFESNPGVVAIRPDYVVLAAASSRSAGRMARRVSELFAECCSH